MFVIGLAALIGSLHAGLHGWIVNFFIRDIAVLLAFLSSIDILRRGGTACSAAVLRSARHLHHPRGRAAGTSGGDELRASGTFPNPNIPGNLLAIAILCWTTAPFRWATKGTVIFLALVGLLAAASFGSMLQLGVGFGYLAISNVDKATNLMRGRRLLMIIPVLLIALGGVLRVQPAEGRRRDRLQPGAIQSEWWHPRSRMGRGAVEVLRRRRWGSDPARCAGTASTRTPPNSTPNRWPT